MKFQFQMIIIIFIIGAGVLVTSFTNCAGMNQGSDEYGEATFTSYSGCMEGRICRSSQEIDCYDHINYFSPEENVVCPMSKKTEE